MTSRQRTVLLSRTILAAVLAGFLIPTPAAAEQVLISTAFQDDFFFGHDGGGYSSGLFISRMRATSPGEDGVAPPWLLSPLVGWLGMPRSTLAATSLSQIIVTPRDISRTDPDPGDAPYLGALSLRSTHVQVQNDVADMLSLDLGVIGPASGAARTQRFAHRLIGSEEPQGWDKQVSGKLLIGIERYRAWRWGGSTATSAGASADAIVLLGGTLGNLQTSAGGSVLLRYGEGLADSFGTVARITGRTGDPFVIGRGWFAYTGVSGDRFFSHFGIGDEAGPANKAQLRKSQFIGLAGIAYGWGNSSLSFSLQSASPLVESSGNRQSFGSITYTWRIH